MTFDLSSVKAIYTLADLKNWPEATARVNPPIRLGIYGDPGEHSLSPQMQNAALRECEIEAQYARFHIAAEELSDALQLVVELKFIGINLTIPHKSTARALITRIDEIAGEIGAVNTIKISAAETIGFNTDAQGFGDAIREEFGVPLRGLRVAILGAGGAARAIAYQCRSEGCATVETWSRRQNVHPRECARDADMIVNATPVGLGADEASLLPEDAFRPDQLIYDTVYSRNKTPFVRAAEAAGARAADGRSMLLHQGARAFQIWCARAAPIDVMRNALAGVS